MKKYALKIYLENQIQKTNYLLIEANVLNNFEESDIFKEVINNCNNIITAYENAIEALNVKDEDYPFKPGGIVSKNKTSQLTPSKK